MKASSRYTTSTCAINISTAPAQKQYSKGAVTGESASVGNTSVHASYRRMECTHHVGGGWHPPCVLTAPQWAHLQAHSPRSDQHIISLCERLPCAVSRYTQLQTHSAQDMNQHIADKQTDVAEIDRHGRWRCSVGTTEGAHRCL